VTNLSQTLALVASSLIGFLFGPTIVLNSEIKATDDKKLRITSPPLSTVNNILLFQNLNLLTTESPKPNIYIEDSEDRAKINKARRKRKRIVKKIIKQIQDGYPNEDIFEVQEIKKRKKKRNGKRKFEKTVSDQNVESNLSESPEKNKKRKPVDIIVHIKMNE
jgi:cell division protein FtsI/penicillin-binding protein 2